MTPGAASFAVPLFAPINAEIVGVVDGGLGTQDAAFGSVGLIVELYGVAVGTMLDAYSLGAALNG